jgi:hypothetical protein
MRDHAKIEAWRLADDLTVTIYERTRSFPRDEIYGLTGQLRRAAYSVPANIVEGASRESKKDYLSLSLYCARLFIRGSVFHSPRAAARLLLVRANTCAAASNEGNICLFAWSYSAVEKEAGKLGKVVASITSLIVTGLIRWSGGQLSVVS